MSQRQTTNREALLDAAEVLFASYGFHAVTVRQITGLAKVRVAEVNDLFGGKSKLFYEVIKRRASVINAIREEGLAAIDTELPREQQLKSLISAFYAPLLEKSRESEGWRHYLRLVTQMIGSRSPVLLTVIEFYNPITQKFLQAAHALYPEISFARLLRHWQFILATYFSVFADNLRVDTLSQGKVRSSDFDDAYEEATAYIHLGIKALIGEPEGLT